MVNWNTLDLNLLRVLDAMLREPNTTRVGERISLASPRSAPLSTGCGMPSATRSSCARAIAWCRRLSPSPFATRSVNRST